MIKQVGWTNVLLNGRNIQVPNMMEYNSSSLLLLLKSCIMSDKELIKQIMLQGGRTKSLLSIASVNSNPQVQKQALKLIELEDNLRDDKTSSQRPDWIHQAQQISGYIAVFGDNLPD